MSGHIVTYLQLFGIGFGFGVAGPCLFACTPVLAAYIAGKQGSWKRALSDILIFLSGRLLAYLVLGFLAGLSAILLRQLSAITFLKGLGGAIIILLGVYVWSGKEPIPWLNNCKASTIFSSGGLFTFGFIIGISPCAPLLALLFEIALISHSAINGMFYALSFGLGTFISGFIVLAVLSGVLTWLPQKFLKSKWSNLVFRIACASLLIWMGLNLFFQLP